MALPCDVSAEGSRIKLRRRTGELIATFLTAAQSPAPLPTLPTLPTLPAGAAEGDVVRMRAVADARGDGEASVAAAAEALDVKGGR